MILSRPSRRLVAGIAAVLFLACQGSAAAYAGFPGAPQAGATATQGSCHDSGQQTGDSTQKSTCQANCESQLTSSTPSGNNIYASADLPVITTLIDRIAAVADSAPLAESPLLRVEPLPLRILHCRLLI